MDSKSPMTKEIADEWYKDLKAIVDSHPTRFKVHSGLNMALIHLEQGKIEKALFNFWSDSYQFLNYPVLAALDKKYNLCETYRLSFSKHHGK